MRAAALAMLLVPLSGCLVHEARIDVVAPTGTTTSDGRSAVLSKVHDGAPSELRRGPLPYEIPASWTLRDGDGRMLAAHVRATSPLPWWQRFPFDLAVDLWPRDVVIAVAATATPVPVREHSAAEITAEAKAHGYAR